MCKPTGFLEYARELPLVRGPHARIHDWREFHEHADGKLVDALGEVKDTVGEWHDWVELERIARKVLGEEPDRELLKRIELTRGQKLQIAMAAANRVRERYFGIPDGRKASRKILQIAS